MTFFPLFFYADIQSIPYQALWIHSHSYESTAVKTLHRRIYGRFSSSYSSCNIVLKAILILCRRSNISQSLGYFLTEIRAPYQKRRVVSIQAHRIICAFASVSDEFPETHRASIRQDHEGRFYEDFYKYVFQFSHLLSHSVCATCGEYHVINCRTLQGIKIVKNIRV